LSTKAGAVLSSFAKWRDLPEPKDNELLKLAALFERKLVAVISKSLKCSFDPMISLHYEGE